MNSSLANLPASAAFLLKEHRHQLSEVKVVAGFDGFVDVILHVVKLRSSSTEYERFTSMAEWAEKIRGAAGLSANFEFVTQINKLGGNGPIMCNALMSMGFQITYIGNLGYPSVHPIFRDFATRAQIFSIADPGVTDAVEFDDGKLMFGKHQTLKEVSWARLAEQIGTSRLAELIQNASLVAFLNWTMLPEMTDIFRHILEEIPPHLKGRRRLFFDLADPAKRSRTDISEVLTLISDFQKYFDVILGLNMGESRQIGEVLGIKSPPEEPEFVRLHAASIQKKLGLSTVVIHPIQFAAAADSHTSAVVAGPHTANPKITTGGGDHFNAGFCLGHFLGGSLDQALQIAVATSGFYVRHAKSPTIDDLINFLSSL